jgi:hypothetical protein
MLTIPIEKLADIIAKAAECDAEPLTMDEIAGKASYQRLNNALESLSNFERSEVLALAWLGRGDYLREEWREAVEEAHRNGSDSLMEYAVGRPSLCDCLKEGLRELGYPIVDYEISGF